MPNYYWIPTVLRTKNQLKIRTKPNFFKKKISDQSTAYDLSFWYDSSELIAWKTIKKQTM